MFLLLSLLAILLSCLIIWKASDGFEFASEYLGRNLSDGVRGATINAIGSSIPELLTTIFFLLLLHDQEGFSGGIGTTAGSAIFNSMVIPAAVILAVIFAGKVTFVKVSKKVILRDGIMLLLSELILIFLLTSGTLYWWHGLILMLMYVIYVIIMFATMEKKEEDNELPEIENNDENDSKDKSTLGSVLRLDFENLIVGNSEINTKKAWSLLIISTMIVAFASALLVVACEQLGTSLDIPVYFVAVILAAAATSVPDTVLSIKDARKGNYDDAVSNALGSNIFDICFALGFPLFMYTILYQPISMSGTLLSNVSELRILLLLLTFIVFILFLVSKKLKTFHAIILLLVYVFFVLFIFGKSTSTEWSTALSNQLLQWSELFK